MLCLRLPLRYASVALALLMGAMLPTGCARKASVPPQAFVPASNDNPVRLTLSPDAPRALDPVVLTAHVTGKGPRPLVGAKVTAALSMPGMTMPPNLFALTPAAPGTYTAQARFSMPGQWAVTVAVVDKGGRTTAAFPVVVR